MIVGSVRREKPSVGDIDLLVVKKCDAGLFGEPAGRLRMRCCWAGRPTGSCRGGA